MGHPRRRFSPADALVSREAKTSTETDRLPLLWVMGAFVFAAQMVNFPVGISAHPVGGTLLALAGVLAMDPEVLLLDESTTSLDPPGQRNLVDALRSLPQS